MTPHCARQPMPPVAEPPVIRRSGRAPRRLALLAAVAPALGCAQADGEWLLREIPSVFAASGFEQPAGDAPSAVTVVTADEIDAHGWRTLAEVLGNLRGFHASSDLAYDYVGVRGVQRPGDWSSRVLLRVDGHRVNADVYGDAGVGEDGIVDLAAVERIEVVRGPGSSLYGASAVYAVVDVVTKRGRDWRGGEAETAAGSRGLRRAAIRGGDRDGGLEWSFAASAMSRGGAGVLALPELAATTPSAGVSRGSDATRAQRLAVGARWNDWSLQAALARWQQQVPTGAYGTVLSDPRNRYDQERAWLRLGRDVELDERTSLRLAWALDRAFYTGDYVYADGSVNRDLADGLSQSWEAMLDRRVDADTRVVAGVDLQRDRRVRQRNADPGVVHIDLDRPGHAEGVYAQVERSLAPTVKVNAGLRADRYSSFGTATSPRLAAIWQPRDGQALKLLAASAYRAPNAYELYYDDGGASQRANPALRPERMRSVELVWEARLSRTAQASVSVYRNRLHGLIDAATDGDDLIRYANSGDIVTRGVEAQFDWRPDSRLDARLMTTWQTNRRDGGDAPLTNSPRRLAKALLTWRAPGDATLGAAVRAVSRTASPDGDRIAGYAVLDLNLGVPLAADWRLALALRNAFDRGWRASAGPEHDPVQTLPQPGRSVELRLSRSL